MPTTLINSTGRSVVLGQRIGGGGEGDVFALVNTSDLVAKLYHPGRLPDSAKCDKLRAMVEMATAQLLAVTTWPSDLLYDSATKRLAGFTMSRLKDYCEVWQLYLPDERLNCFPQAGWKFQSRAAQNLACAFDEVHATGTVVGDVQLRNAHVSPQALVRLIDCDSFQLVVNGKQHFCEVGLPHYIPPELQGKNLRGIARTHNHDRFGLAVLIYQLLFVGRHPYAGRYSGKEDLSFDQLITQYRFAQGPLASSWGMSPAPFTPTFHDIPPELGSLFRRAFERGSQNDSRPTAAEWIPVLRRLEQATTTCAVDPGHEYWSGAPGCVWCRLAANNGPEYYFGVSATAVTFVVDESRLQSIQRRLAAAMSADFPYSRNAFLSPQTYVGRSFTNDLSGLVAKLQNIRQQEEREALSIRKRLDDEEIERRQLLSNQSKRYHRRLLKETAAINAELVPAQTHAIRETKSRESRTYLLFAAALLGGLLIPLVLFQWYFGVVGGTLFVTFGFWAVVRYYLGRFSPAQQRVRSLRKQLLAAHNESNRRIEMANNKADEARTVGEQAESNRQRSVHRRMDELREAVRRFATDELDRRRRVFRDAESAVVGLESAWKSNASTIVAQRTIAKIAIDAKCSECRGLSSLHQNEFQRLGTLAEAAAKVRHLRLHSLADANIEGIGAGLKSTLADHGIYTAMDVTPEAVRQVPGFGEKRILKLIQWKTSEVLSKFRFDPKTALSPADRRSLTMRFSNLQKSLISELDRAIAECETSSAMCTSAIENIKRQLPAAIHIREQAYADMLLLSA